MLKKAGLVAIATIGLSLAATPAFAAPAVPANTTDAGVTADSPMDLSNLPGFFHSPLTFIRVIRDITLIGGDVNVPVEIGSSNR